MLAATVQAHLETYDKNIAQKIKKDIHVDNVIRGVPNAIISDKALQFKTSSATMDLLWNKVLKCEDVLNYMAKKRIRWHFIVERAPWYSGFYKSLVGVVKHSDASS